VAEQPSPAGGGGHTASLATRLALSVALVLVVGGTAVALAAFAYGRQAAQQAYDRLLIGAADQIAGSVSVRDGRILVDIPASAFELLALAPDDRLVYAVLDPEGRLVTGHAGVERPAARFANGAFAGEPARLIRVSRQFAERDYAGAVDVVVGQTTRARDALAREITRSALVGVGLVGLLMAGLAAFAIRSALTPLRHIEAGLAAREPRDLTPLDVAVPREIGALVATINRFMARQARQFEIMRNLIADASHQLRTPVAALRAQAELAADEPEPARQRAIVARIHDRAVGLGRLTDQLLNHALIIHRADAAPHATVDLRAVAIRIVEELDGVCDLRLDLPEDPLLCRGDALSLAEAGKNLVNNALRHGAPPVSLDVRREGACAALAVRDRGPGMPEALWAGVGARYDRTGSVTPHSAGIGLAIVVAVAAAHRGELRFGRHASGDFEAALILPATPDSSAPASPGSRRAPPARSPALEGLQRRHP
jgi:two-component system sensor histidine kinase TctE